ncbi:MAG TPA: ABC transporter ATP-binding protein [Alphaproteobacteria bacterium]|nr:ABC transporter ATP-binding protein [Alphaproteobacteria bacterium]
MTAPILVAGDVTKRFGGFTALDRVSVAVKPGERLGLIGPNGSGKSTFVNCVAGTLRPESGRLRFDGADITGLAPHERRRRGIARTFQIPRPFASMSVLGNLRIPLEYASHGRPRAAVRDEAEDILVRVGLAGKAASSPANLTQIELRKLELARAIAVRPRLLIADEAMAGLTASEVDEMLALLLGLAADGITIIMIEHIMRAVMRFSERLVVLDAGRIIAEGTPADVVRNPAVEQAYLGE